MLVSPLVRFGSEQADWVKSARALGIPVGFPVFSWDNLTTKGIIHVQPDRVFVWNEVQKREATRVLRHSRRERRDYRRAAIRLVHRAARRRSDREAYCRRLSISIRRRRS